MPQEPAINAAPLNRVTCLEEMLLAEKERETLILRVRELDTRLRELRRLLPAKTSAHQPRTRAANPNRRPRGALRKQIMDALEEAKGKNIHVRALASCIGVDPKLIHAWLSSYLKRIPGLTRVAPGVFNYIKQR